MAHRRQGMFGLRHDPSAMHDQFAAGWRGECALADALDKLQAAAIFQFTDLLADCRLRQMQAFRRLGEAAERRRLQSMCAAGRG